MNKGLTRRNFLKCSLTAAAGLASTSLVSCLSSEQGSSTKGSPSTTQGNAFPAQTSSPQASPSPAQASSFATQGSVLPAQASSSPAQASSSSEQGTGGAGESNQAYSIPPLYCVAYIDPRIPSQANQESMIARYPLTIVPQAINIEQVNWRDKIRSLNSKIVMLGYEIACEATQVPGPGHDQLRKVVDAWVVDSKWNYVTIENGKRIYDPRNTQWQEAFLDACRVTLQSYPYDGLFLDQCTVFDVVSSDAEVKAEMRAALQSVLLRLRQEYPNTLFVGNSGYNWKGLNGEMDEGNLQNIGTQLAPFNGHVQPYMDMYQSLLHTPNDVATVKKEMDMTHALGGFYGAAVDYQHVLWFDLFDEFLAQYK